MKKIYEKKSNRESRKDQYVSYGKNIVGKHSGFTLTELIVVLAISAILLGLTIFGILAWQDWATFNKQNEYAQSLFVAAQNQLAEYGANGKLGKMTDEFLDVDDGSVQVGMELTQSVLESMVIGQKEDGSDAYYEYETIWPESYLKTNPRLYQDKIVAITADAQQYSQYLNNPSEFKKQAGNQAAYWVFELLGEYIYDTSILNDGAISIEFTPRDGQVFSVFYSEKNAKFTYTGSQGGAGTADLCNRSDAQRKEKMVGFYGVDSLYASTENKQIQPKLSRVVLHNEDTLYLTYRLTKHKEASQLLQYDITLFEDETDSARLSFTLDGTKIKNAENAQRIDCDVLRYEPSLDESHQVKKDTDGNVIYEAEGTAIGTFPILAYIEKDRTIRVLFDAADVQATTFLYKQDLSKIRGGQIYAGEGAYVGQKSKFADTYSFFRFGVGVTDIYASVKGFGDGFKDTNTKKSNTKNSAFESQTVTGTEEAALYRVGLKNARHFYNMRYYEDLSYVQQAGGDEDVMQVAGVTYILNADIDFRQFQKTDKQLFDSNVYLSLSKLNQKLVDVDAAGSALPEDIQMISAVTRLNCEFPSFSQLREKSVLDGKKHSISGLTISELSDAYYGIYTNPLDLPLQLDEKKPVGLFHVNYGEIEDLTLDNIRVSGSDMVGGFCGVNAGTVTDLSTANSNQKSKITGVSNVGGLIGFQMPSDSQLTIKNLENRAAVEGVKAVGGILGMVRNDFADMEIDKLPGYSKQVEQVLKNPEALSIKVTDCKNYGSVWGCNRENLKGIYTSEPENNQMNANTLGASLDEREKKGTEARYIGGIVGYCYNKYSTVTQTQDDTEKIKIENCISSPQMEETELLTILGDRERLENKQVGVYVGGIVGYNHFGQINSCSAKSEKDKDGYLIGYRYVGGIVGMNIGPASGIVGSSGNEKGTNENHIVAYEYAGGITGCNANVLQTDSLGNDISAANGKDPESLIGVLRPDPQRNLFVKIDNWVNKGIVIATGQYAGGITGFNAGTIYGCNCQVEAREAETYFNTLYSGNYAGGIAGYNNGVIGNTKRIIADNGYDSTVAAEGERFSTVSYVKGHHYVGGIVGYNDVDSVLENYEVASGSVLGDEGSCFVGGYAGLNASVDLLMDQSYEQPRMIYSNPNKVEGSYCVGGNIGGNIINTNGFTGGVAHEPSETPKNPQEAASESQKEDAYAYFSFRDLNDWERENALTIYGNFCLHNGTQNALITWSVPLDDVDGVDTISLSNYVFDSQKKEIRGGQSYNHTLPANQDAETSWSITFTSIEKRDAFIRNYTGKQLPIYYFGSDNNKNGEYWGNAANPEDCAFQYDVQKNAHNDYYQEVVVSFQMTNRSENVLPNWRIDFQIPAGLQYTGVSETYGLDSNIDGNGNVTLKPLSNQINLGRDVIQPGDTLSFTLTFRFNNRAQFDSFFADHMALTFNNVLYYGDRELHNSKEEAATPDPGENDVKADVLTYFKTDNFLGTLDGTEFVGGFVGYNLLFDATKDADWITADEDGDRGGVFVLQKKLVEAFSKVDEGTTDEQERLLLKKDIVDDLDGNLQVEVKPSDRRIYISGKEAEPTTTTFGQITGQIFVGGVMGYNDENTHLFIEHVQNATPILALKAVRVDKEQVIGTDENNREQYRSKDYAGRDKIYEYSYAGGIVGKVTKYITVNDCQNTSTGDVQTKGTYTGGLCEINEGTLIKCSASSFGSSVTDYVGGLCGLNKSLIEDCAMNGKTVSGRNMVGGMVCENFGTIRKISWKKPKMLVAGLNDSTRDGVCGLYAAYNGESGVIELDQDVNGINIDSNGRYVGGIVGYNAGELRNLFETEYHSREGTKEATDKNLIIDGKIQGYQTVGGLIGYNQNEGNAIEYYTNQAKVTATHGNAGGVIGENAASNIIRFCVNDAVVSATDAGNAGGITSSNNGLITKCVNDRLVSAPDGMCGGIAAVNKENGSISYCRVAAKEGAGRLTFTSTKVVGGVAAQNAGRITCNVLRNVKLTNDTAVKNSTMGMVAGDNLKTGIIVLSDSRLSADQMENCEILVQSNYSKAGGIAGTNAGRIGGTVDDTTGEITSVISPKITMEKASYANIGGVAGVNTGYISDVAVDTTIQGDLGSSFTGYGGIAGCSGFSSKEKLLKQQVEDDTDYPVQIVNCTFDGILNATGSSGAPAHVGGIVGINGYGSSVTACHIGARSADSAGNSTEDSQVTYITAGDYIHKTAESVSTTDTKSYAYLGGIAGDNYGRISACDNAKYSSDRVEIIGFAGETGGIAGYNYAYGIISGYLDEDGKTEHYLTTGKNWSIEQRCCGNDRGPGGVIGKSDSAEDMSYVINYAPVTCVYQSNTYVAGLIGVLEQQYRLKTKFYKCENYGDLTSWRSAGGFIGMLKSNGADFEECINWGDVLAMSRNSGGFIALHHTYSQGTDFRHCANHGNVTLEKENATAAGGFIGGEEKAFSNLDDKVESYLYDCVNTGLVKKGDGTGPYDKVGHFVGQPNSRISLEQCRNYNTRVSANGLVGASGDLRLKNCLDDSGNQTRNLDVSPIGGGYGWNTNLFYLDRESGTTFSQKDYGVYFSVHEGPNGNFSFNDANYKDALKDPSYLFAEPDKSNKIILYGSAVKQLNISLDYDSASQGLESMVVHLWNGSDKSDSAPSGTYTVSATYFYNDGTSIMTEEQTKAGFYGIDPQAQIILQNPSADKKPVKVRIKFNNQGKNINLRGLSYIPVAESATGKQAVCTYLGRKNDTTFHIEKLGKTKSSGDFIEITYFGKVLPADVGYCYPDDVMDIDWTDYSHFRLEVSHGETGEISFDVRNGENAPGMDSFVFYVANYNINASAAQKDRTDYYYDYSVTFTDRNGKTATTEMKQAIGYDPEVGNALQKGRQQVPVPEGLDPVITSIQLHIKSDKYTWIDANGILKTNYNAGYVYLRGFGWIPKGQTKEQKMAAGSAATNNNFYDRWYGNGNKKNIHLKVDNSTTPAYIYLPYQYESGFQMTHASNQPVAETYYADQTDYTESKTETGDSGSRIDTYLDLDPKFMDLTRNLCTVYNKLDMPTGLTLVEAESYLKYKWNTVKNAYAYEVYYKITDEAGKVIYQSEKETIGSLQLNYAVPIDPAWKNNQIEFFVRAINAYHPDHEDETASDYDSDYEKYDSDWNSSMGAVVKKALPKPKIHLEIVAGNRTTFVLENYEEYVEEGCTDCTIVLSYNGEPYNWNVAENGKYRIPGTVDVPDNSGLANISYYAQPNESLKNDYSISGKYVQAGEGHGNNVLPYKDRYCTTNFQGFYGTQADSMEYQIVFSLNSQDTYLMTDISAYDKTVGATVAYDSEITHAANSYSGGGSVQFTSTLKNLPKEWFSAESTDKIIARAYPYHSQYDIIHYGHDVAEGIILDQTVEENRRILSEIYDNDYFPADGSQAVSNCIWDAENQDLKPGYVLLKQDDGTYNVFYSAVIEMSKEYAKEQNDPYREYFRYDVDYRIYSQMGAETAGNILVNSADYQESFWSRGQTDKQTYNNTKTDSNEKRYLQEIHTAPVVEEAAAATDNEGNAVYSFRWDRFYQDTACFDTRSNRYQNTNDNGITNPPEKLFPTWDMYLEHANHAALSAVGNTQIRRLMNAYYNSYRTANYRIDLIGTTLDGKEVVLSTATVDQPMQLPDVTEIENANHTVGVPVTKGGKETTYHVWEYTYSFTDVEHTWNRYPVITARIMRLGSMSSVSAFDYNNGNTRTDSNGSVYILPRYTEVGMQQKLTLDSISKPNVTLSKENGQFVTDSLRYEVDWGAITDESQLDDLGGYLITVKASENNTRPVKAKTHYYYIEELGNPLLTDEIGLDRKALLSDGVLVEIKDEDYLMQGDGRTAYLDLSDYETGDIVTLSVKAIARKHAVIYEDGADGVETEITIPSRLAVPQASKLELVAGENGGMPDYESASCTQTFTHVDEETGECQQPQTLSHVVTTDAYRKGLAFRYQPDDESYSQEPTAKIRLAIAVFDEKPENGELDVSMVSAQDAPSVSDGKIYWNSGAYRTLYPKAEGFSLGYAKAGDICHLDMETLKLERYTGEFAGKWLKIAIKAESATRIDSQWSDQDSEDYATINYVWIHLPKLLLDDTMLQVSGLEEAEEVGPVSAYLADGQITFTQPDDGNYTTVTMPVMEVEEDPCADYYEMTIIGKKQESEQLTYTPVYKLYLQKSYEERDGKQDFDGTWDVYLAPGSAYTSIDKAIQNAQSKGYVIGNTITLGADRSKILTECVGNEAAVYIGNIGTYRTDEAAGQTSGAASQNEEQTASELLLDDISLLFSEGKDEVKTGTLLCYRQTAGAQGVFRIILPEILSIDDDETDRRGDDYIGISRILVQKQLLAGSQQNYVLPKAMLYRNIGMLQDGTQDVIYTKERYPFDETDSNEWLAELDRKLQTEAEEAEALQRETQPAKEQFIVSDNSMR